MVRLRPVKNDSTAPPPLAVIVAVEPTWFQPFAVLIAPGDPLIAPALAYIEVCVVPAASTIPDTLDSVTGYALLFLTLKVMLELPLLLAKDVVGVTAAGGKLFTVAWYGYTPDGVGLAYTVSLGVPVYAINAAGSLYKPAIGLQVAGVEGTPNT